MTVATPILITGVPRSGTSMVAGCFSISGAWTGETIGPGKDNPKGFFENKRIREQVTKGYLRSNGFDPMGQINFPPLRHSIGPQDHHHSSFVLRQVNGILESEGYKEGPWLYKDAKLALMWTLWAATYRTAKWILVRRDEREIAASCLKTGFMRVHNTEENWIGWIKEYEKRFEPLKESCQVYELWHHDIVDGSFEPLEVAIKSCGLNWDEEKIKDFIIK